MKTLLIVVATVVAVFSVSVWFACWALRRCDDDARGRDEVGP